ncbi:MAG: hypothetical protein JWO80_5118 [Bryobacterales bacterium]|nr:hypothetical protein [Bryobacterales bacterium]
MRLAAHPPCAAAFSDSVTEIPVCRCTNEQPSRSQSEHGRFFAADFFGASSVASALGIRSGATPGEPRCQQRDGALPRQTVVAIGLHDRALLAGCRDGHQRGALGTLGERHDLLAKLVIAGLRAQASQRLSYIGRLDLAPVCRHYSRRRPGSGEPQSGGIQLEQARITRKTHFLHHVLLPRQQPGGDEEGGDCSCPLHAFDRLLHVPGRLPISRTGRRFLRPASSRTH